jgi:carboxymethylenebutenolidase
MQLTQAEAGPPTVCTRVVRLEGRHESFAGLLATPAGAAWKSATVVVADRNGVDDHARTVCRDLALAGHAALAIDLRCLPPSTEGRTRSLTGSAALTRATGAVATALAFLRRSGPPTQGRFGVVGFGEAGLVALAAGYRCQAGVAVSFYGDGPMRLRMDAEEIIDSPKRQAASFLCLIGGEDPDITPADLGALRAHLDASGMRHTFIVYPRTRAGFCHPESPTYRPADARDAWARLLHALATAPRLRHRFAPKEHALPSASPRVRAASGASGA